ncbi:hypothetical protein F5B19DRAFT_479250 [Rostrohypoxylon terebratum]|nr:hypothetical protein F5B19DRAFT_479250 [Rostrohypoxylon terebratum]
MDLFWTPLTAAIFEAHESLAMMIAERSALTPEDEQAKPTKSPLVIAALRGMPNIIKLLLSKGWSASQRIAKHGNTTPLHWAALRSDNHEVIDILISHGADIYAESNDEWWRSPLLTAVYENEQGNLACMISKAKEKGTWVEDRFPSMLEGDTFLAAMEKAVPQLDDGVNHDEFRLLFRDVLYWYGFNGTTEMFVRHLVEQLNKANNLYHGDEWLLPLWVDRPGIVCPEDSSTLLELYYVINKLKVSYIEKNAFLHTLAGNAIDRGLENLESYLRKPIEDITVQWNQPIGYWEWP